MLATTPHSHQPDLLFTAPLQWPGWQWKWPIFIWGTGALSTVAGMTLVWAWFVKNPEADE